MNSSTFSPLGRHIAAGVVALTLLAARAQGQYVSTAISNQLNEPYGVTADPTNNVYIADTFNNRIALYAFNATNVVNLAGSNSFSGSGTNDGAGSAAGFNQPVGIVYAPARGGLVVVDQGNQELRFVTTNGVVSTLAGKTGQYGFVDGSNLAQVQFSFPAGIAVGADGGTLYIADAGNNAIRMLSYPSNVLSTIATNFVYNSVTHPFFSPSAVAVDNQSNIWVADSLDEVICVISNGLARGVAGKYRTSGTNDSLTASSATFNLPSGLVWDSAKNILVISDTRNDTIRSLYITNGVYAINTLAGLPTQRGYVDGQVSVAKFSQQAGICIDVIDSGYYVADTFNNALRTVQPTQPPPAPLPVPDPVIGYLTFPLVNGTAGAQFNPITSPVSVFNNAVPLVIEQLDGTVQTYVSFGATGTIIPAPGPATGTVTPYTSEDDGKPPGSLGPVILSPPALTPNVTVKAISQAPRRPSSDAVSAQIQYITANPNIIGTDASSIILSNATAGAQLYYTLDGSSPTNDGSDGVGPFSNGSTLSLNITSNVILSVRAFTPGFAPSDVVTQSLTLSNFIGNELTFGFSSGNSSSKFITAAGRYFFAPVTLSLLPGATMYSFQFNLNETNVGAAPPINSSAWQFQSFLRKPTLVNGVTFLSVIDPGIVITNGTNGFTNQYGTFTNDNLMGVGWIEIYPETNLYDTLNQDLITYSEAHDREFTEAEGKAVVGAFAFPIPPSAALGSQYQIQANRPSATTYFPPAALPQGVAVRVPTNGSLAAGAVNSIKNVTVGSASYLVGDAFPFSWLNAGDFGDSNLLNDDVIEVFQTAIYNLSGVPANSDFFDAMDSSDGSYNNLYDANDGDINAITQGDGKLMVDDVYVTFKRSLDTNLAWYVRTWVNGNATPIISTFTNFGATGAHSVVAGAQVSPTPTNPVYLTVAADQVQTGGNLSVQIPVRLWTGANYPLRVMMLNVEIDPLDGSPPITNAVSFSTGGNFGTPTLTSSQGVNSYGAAWLDSTVTGVKGTNVVGSISVTLPPNVTSNSAYRVHFNHFSGSPNGLALFHSTVQDGLITVGDRSGSSWKDGISDAWRLVNFGSVSNSLSAATADPDGDGASNWAEYVAGTNPNDATSAFKFSPVPSMAPSTFTLQWPSVVNKTYTLQCCYDFAHGKWATVATNIQGTGQMMQWTDTNATGQSQYYRALVQ